MVVTNNERVNYYYKVYGLIVKSQVLLPELIVPNENEIQNIDVDVTYGIMTKDVKESLEKGINYNLEKDKMWFFVNNVAHYYITNGEFIVVESCEDADKAQIKAFLLGSAFGFLLIQRNKLAIHGGTILIDGKAIIFTGDTGAGKSTMTAAFRERGYLFMADDVSVVGQAEDGTHIIYPGYPQQKLCKDAVKNMGYSPEDFIMIDDDREKYIIPAKESFIDTPTAIGAIIELSVGEGEEVEISEVLGSEKLISLMRNIYRIEVTNFSGLSREYFKKCLEVAKNIPIYKIKRPRGRRTVEEQISIILSKLAPKKNEAI